MALSEIVSELIGPKVPVAVRAYDGSAAGPPDPVGTLVLNRPEALQRFLTAPGELGLGRAYVAGDIDLDGDIFATFEAFAQRTERGVGIDRRLVARLGRQLGPRALRRVPPPPEEVRLHGRRHSPGRDAAAIAHHYDLSNDFYALVLGPSLTYSCAVWQRRDVTLEDAQAAKHELVAVKLGLEPGQRLLDVGCGWGSMALHAAAHHGARVVGVTLSLRQAELARKRVAEAGLEGQVEIRLQDERDVDDGPYDAISSIGMFEHVGRERLRQYASHLCALLRPGGRLLNHGIARPAQARDRHRVPAPRPPWPPRNFVERFVFPDGELHEVGSVVSVLQQEGFEARHLENLREHYALTLRAWVANLERNWDRAVQLSGEGRARVWRLYMVASAKGFETGRIQIHQALAVKSDGGSSGLPLRPRLVLPGE